MALLATVSECCVDLDPSIGSGKWLDKNARDGFNLAYEGQINGGPYYYCSYFAFNPFKIVFTDTITYSALYPYYGTKTDSSSDDWSCSDLNSYS